MGLPLYRAPVESDIKAKLPRDPPTRARSTIRRDRRTTGLNGSETSSARFYESARFYARRRGRVASPGAETPWSPWDHVGSEDATAPPRTAPRRSAFTTEPYPVPQAAGRQNDPAQAARPTDSALREVASRNGMSQEMARYFGEHMARLHAATSSRPSQTTEDSNPRDETEPFPGDSEFRSWVIPSDRPSPPRHTPRFTATPFWRSSRQPDANARASDSQPAPRVADVVLRRQDGHLVAMRRLRAVRVERTPTPGDAGTQQAATQQDSSVDGLGDRNRSLSPEDDGVWDTLLSSITPDPQPPSVGTSFASTSTPASAATSQSTGTGTSAHTHITAPATLDALEEREFDFDHPCESGGDNSDTEGEGDDDEEERRVNTLRRFARQRSYADVVGRREEEEDLEMLGEGGVDDMQRIVGSLARREDIPDEWWAEVGLSRSLPREA